jgi:co-chaperonin GroES (HSP10)
MTTNVALDNGGNSIPPEYSKLFPSLIVPVTAQPVSDDKLTEQEIADLFPDVKPNIRPFGSRVLVQIRRPRTKSKGGIHYAPESQATELDNTCVAKVIAIGPLAYKNRNTLEHWAEGQWCQPGSYVFVPKYGGVRWEKTAPELEGYYEKVQFAIFDDLNMIGEVEDPTDIKAHI